MVLYTNFPSQLQILNDELGDEDISKFLINEAKKRKVECNSFNLLYRLSQFELIEETKKQVNEAKETVIGQLKQIVPVQVKPFKNILVNRYYYLYQISYLNVH